MRRVFNKTVSFCLFLLLCIGLLTPSAKSYAQDISEYILKVIAENEYSDAVRFGNGYLMLKNGTFDNITANTTYTFIDENGNTREIKNDIGFTEIYLNTSGGGYYVDYGALVIKKGDKVAIMDLEGKLYGGTNNFYSCVMHAGDNMFYTTNDTEGKIDKADTTKWTLRRKDGSIVKEFNNLVFSFQRVHSNGYEYIMHKDNNENELLVINSNGDISSLGKNYIYYEVKAELGYLVAYKESSSGNGYLTTVFKEDGTKVFEVDNCSYLDIENYNKFGYAKVGYTTENGDTQNLIDKNGNFVFEEGKYYTISGFDNNQAIAIDRSANMYLVDYSDRVVFDVDKFAKSFGESYSAITFSSYYIDDTLTVTLVDNNKVNDVGNTFFFNDNGEKIMGNIKGRIVDSNGFNGTYALLYDNIDESYGLISKNGIFEKRGYEHIQLRKDPNESNVVAVANKSIDSSKILIMSDGRDINEYDQFGDSPWWPSRVFVNGHALVRKKGTNQYGIIDTNGKEIIPVGEYENFVQYDDNECILAYKDNKPYLFDTNGKVLNTVGQYKNIGDYITSFYRFVSGGNYTEYKDYMKANNMTITKNYQDKLGLVKVVPTNLNDFDCDINGDGKIDILDMASLGMVYGKNSTEAGWNQKGDFNKDNVIDIFDLVILSKKL